MTTEKKILRGGWTTGACAAAGAKAALLFLRGKRPHNVDIIALDGTKLTIPVKNVMATAEGATAEIVKFSGDDPDITDGISIFVAVRPLPSGNGIKIIGGKGVGIVTKPGLDAPVGEAAINKGPRKLINNVAAEILGEGGAAEIVISVPEGEHLAQKTLNPALGIVGGISIIGTTGVLRPMSEEAFKDSLAVQLSVAQASGFSSVVLVPGKIGANIAEKCGVAPDKIVQMSNFVGFMLEKCVEYGMKKILIFGHLGKLAKVAAGSFHTHNRVADGRMEAMAAYAAECGADIDTVKKILASVTTEEALTALKNTRLAEAVCGRLAERAEARARRFLFNQAEIGVVIVTFKGEILGKSPSAQRIEEEIINHG